MGLKLRERGGRLQVEGVVNGRRIRRSTKCSVEDRKRADMMRLKIEVEETLRGDKAGGETVASAAREYLNRPEGMSKSTRRHIEVFAQAFGEETLEKIDLRKVAKWVGSKDVKVNSVARELTSIQACLNWARKTGLTERSFRIHKSYVDDTRDRFLETEEIERFIEACAEEIRPLALFLFLTGARSGEAVKVEWSDILEVGGVKKVRLTSIKGKDRKPKIRLVPLHKRVLEALEKLPHREGVVFLRDNGRPWQYNQLAAFWKEVGERAGIENFNLHDARRTFATQLIRRGVWPVLIMELMGHSSMTMLKRYAYLAPSQSDDAISRL